MVTLIAVALTCWLCSLIALPRRPLPNNEMQELVYARLLGRHHVLRLLALIVTAVLFLALVMTLPSRVDATLRAHRVCTHPSIGFPTCYSEQRGGTWAREELGGDGNWIVVGTVFAPPET
ncbi:MAG: hypothetical protein ACYDAR_16065 [Thermomicrobiales bacterium]